MSTTRTLFLAVASWALAGCTTSTRQTSLQTSLSAAPEPNGQLAQIYYWRARPGKFEEYTRYIRDVAEPIDREAQRRGAFLSVTTHMTQDTLNPWTHMRVFLLRDSAQLRGLSPALDSAGIRLEPDSAKRRLRGVYSAGLRDRVGAVVTRIVR